jgi:hypothetical protein
MIATLCERMVGLGRFELPTLGLGNQCSIHLSYSPASPVYHAKNEVEGVEPAGSLERTSTPHRNRSKKSNARSALLYAEHARLLQRGVEGFFPPGAVDGPNDFNLVPTNKTGYPNIAVAFVGRHI